MGKTRFVQFSKFLGGAVFADCGKRVGRVVADFHGVLFSSFRVKKKRPELFLHGQSSLSTNAFPYFSDHCLIDLVPQD